MSAQPISTPTEPPAAIKFLIDKALGGINRKDSAQMLSSSMEWLLTVGQVRMLRVAGSPTQRTGHTNSLSPTRTSHTTGSFAQTLQAHRTYVVLSATFSFTIKGQHGGRLGILTFTLARQGDGWKIESQAWGRLS